MNLYGALNNSAMHWVDHGGLTDIAAKAVFGETAGLYPQKIKKGSIYNPNTWDPTSYAQLQEARSYIADIRERNKVMHSATPGSNEIEKRVWRDCKSAADKAEEFNLPKDVMHFYIGQEGEP